MALIDLDFEVELTGFETAEIDLCLEEAREAAGEPGGPEDEIPAYAGALAVSRPGDLWQLGPHLLLCDDARDPAAYVQLFGDTKAECVFTDPPYNVPIDGHVCGLGRIRHRSFAMGCGEMSEAEFTRFLTTIFKQLAELKNLCVWNKNNAGMGSFYRSKHEASSISRVTCEPLPF